MKYILLLAFSFICLSVFSQEKYDIRGKIYSSTDGKWLADVSIGIKELPQTGYFSDDSGNYTISLPRKSYTLIFNILGYKTKEVKIDLEAFMHLDVEMEPEAVSLGEILVSGKYYDNIKNTQLGVDHLNIETINKIPVLLGERDVLKTIQLLPGVQTAGEGNTGFYVRGGGGDQNLILLDNATVYNPSHLLGFFSTFNSDVVKDIALYKGSMPAQYGGRLSSTLDIGMKDGNTEKFGAGGGIGLISSKLYVEGPIQKEKSSFIVAARRTYADMLARAIGVEAVKNSSLYFYDLNAKLSYFLTPKDKVSLTAYHGKDKLGMNNIASFDWSNTVASLKWSHIPNDKFVSNTSFSYTNYTYNVGVDLTTGLDITSHIRDFDLNQEFNFYPNARNKIKLGFTSTHHGVVPGELSSKDPDRLTVSPYQHHYSWENVLFVSNEMNLTDRLDINYVLRLSAFSVLGGGAFYEYDDNHQVTDSIKTRKGDFVKTYWNLEPRVALTFLLNKNSSLKAGYSRTTQHLHLLSTSNMANPTDRWVSNTNYIKPEIGDQISVGYFRTLSNNDFEFSAEAYYKKFKNQIDYKDDAEIYNKDNIETELLFGKGIAYGLELFLKKKYGRFNGWVGYTLSRSKRKIDGVNDNEWYVSNQDRTHDFSVVGIYELNKRWTISGTWVYSTGRPMTFPSGKYTVDGHTIYYYEGRNKYRAKAFHRLDLGANYVLKKTKKYYSELSFGLYNAYARHNAYMYNFKQNTQDEIKSEVKMIYLFSIIPAISWNFKF